MAEHLYQQIETLWTYMQLDHQLIKSDCLFVLCSNDLRVAEHAVDLYQQDLAPVLVFSGGEGRFTEGLFDRSEAETFAALAKDRGVPSSAIYIENQSTNTGENVRFTSKMLDENKLHFSSFILVQKPFMERRAYATFMKQWPSKVDSVLVSSSKSRFFDYISEEMPLDLVVNALVSDYERIKNYPEKGFQIEQAIPDNVESAYQSVLSRYPNINNG